MGVLLSTCHWSFMDDYEDDERKQAAADALFQYSQFVMTCIGEGVRPSQLRMHLMKELSGMPTSLKKERCQHPRTVIPNLSPVPKADRASSSAPASVKKGDKQMEI
eukprot:c21345_g1_i3 orf=267-584(+)